MLLYMVIYGYYLLLYGDLWHIEMVNVVIYGDCKMPNCASGKMEVDQKTAQDLCS